MSDLFFIWLKVKLLTLTLTFILTYFNGKGKTLLSFQININFSDTTEGEVTCYSYFDSWYVL